MPKNHAAKQATRQHMRATGLKYTEARRTGQDSGTSLTAEALELLAHLRQVHAVVGVPASASFAQLVVFHRWDHDTGYDTARSGDRATLPLHHHGPQHPWVAHPAEPVALGAEFLASTGREAATCRWCHLPVCWDLVGCWRDVNGDGDCGANPQANATGLVLHELTESDQDRLDALAAAHEAAEAPAPLGPTGIDGSPDNGLLYRVETAAGIFAAAITGPWTGTGHGTRQFYVVEADYPRDGVGGFDIEWTDGAWEAGEHFGQAVVSLLPRH